MGRQLGALALLAMLVRAIVPAGYMLAAAEAADGRYLAVQLCDSHGGFTRLIDLDTGEQVDPNSLPASPAGKPSPNESGRDGSGKAPCLFASAPHLASPQAAPEIAVFRALAVAAVIATDPVSPGRGIPAPPPPSTGPPQLI